MFEDGEDEMTTMLDAWFEECVRFLGQNDAWRDDAALIGQEKGRSFFSFLTFPGGSAA